MMLSGPEEFIDCCNSDQEDAVLRTLNDSAPLEVWEKILKYHPEYSMDVAQNRTIPDEIYEILSLCEDVNVRELIARKGRLPAKLFKRLANDEDESVRVAIAVHRKTSKELRNYLLSDKSENVVRAAKYHLAHRKQ